MDDTQTSYFLLAQGFVVVLNLMVILGLWLLYRNSGKRYLAIVALAGVIETTRQISDALLTSNPNSLSLYLVALTVQFAASAVLLYALVTVKKDQSRIFLILIGILTLAFLLSLIYQYLEGFPDSVLISYAIYVPMLSITALIVARSWSVGVAGSPSSLFLILSATALLILRLALPALQGGEIFVLLYYLGYLVFPTMMAALVFSEAEFAHRKVEVLLAEKKQTAQDLKFILDHSLDVILTADKVGLLRSWNMRAEQQFGYTEKQAVGRIHIDELFVDNYWHENVDDAAEFQSQMEHVEGRTFWVKVRMQTIEQDDEIYSIYVLRDTSEQDRIAEKQIELDRELKRVHQLRQTGKGGEIDDQ